MPHFYRREGQRFEPTDLARSPWQKGVQNGVGLGGLLAFLIDDIPTAEPMITARLVIDILSAAPFAPLDGRAGTTRDGRRMQHVQSELLAGDRVVARATALRVRRTDTPPIVPARDYPAPEDVAPGPFMDGRAFGGTMETRPVEGGARPGVGPGRLWVRFNHQHVEGVALSPLVRVATVGDFGSGVGRVLPVRDWSFPNLDISVHMTREAAGDWLLLDACTESAGNGVAVTSAIMADRTGPFARVHQALFVAPRE